MSLRSPFWRLNPRLQRAAANNKAMRQGEPDAVAVELMQEALVSTGIAPALVTDGKYGPKTAAAIQAVEKRFNMHLDEGVAGRQTLGIVDILLQNGQLGADLARLDVPLATRKVRAAIAALLAFQTARRTGGRFDQITVDALLTHFRLAVATSTIGVARLVTDADLATILQRYNELLRLFAASASRFQTGVPVNGIFTAAESPLGGPVRFGPAYTDVNSNFGGRIGPNSRAAVVIHEGVHVFDGQSGRKDTHISEFEPAYSRQPADKSLHNPSSFAGFAAHIDNRGDPSPRFGLGPGARGL